MSMYEIASGSDICIDVDKSDNAKFMQILKTIAIDENQDREKSDDIQFQLSESPNLELSLTIHSQSYDYDMQMTPSVVTTADDAEHSLIPFQNRHHPDLLITSVDSASELSETNPQKALIPAPALVQVKGIVLKQAPPEMSAQPEIPDVERLKIDEPTAQSPNAPSPDPAAQQPSKEAPETLEAADEEAFESNFKNFAKFGDPKSDGKLITLSNSDKWMKQAKIIDGKKITTTDTGIYFKKLKSQKVSVKQYKTFIEDLAKAKKVEVNQIVKKLSVCGAPGLHGIANAKATETVNRLTDTSKYTGTHKQRFDQTGKGKGIAGRKDLPDNSGYVTGYQHKDTYEAK